MILEVDSFKYELIFLNNANILYYIVITVLETLLGIEELCSQCQFVGMNCARSREPSQQFNYVYVSS